MKPRQRLFVDREVQGVLLGRVVIYWIASILYVALGSVGFQYFNTPDMTFGDHLESLYATYWAWIPSALLILPLVVFDVLRLSHRFAGPKQRLSQTLEAIQNGSPTKPISFRDDDCWHDLAAPVNQLREHIADLRQQVIDLNDQCESLKSEQLELEHIVEKQLSAQPLPEQTPADAFADRDQQPNPPAGDGPRTQSGTRLATESSH